MKDLEHEGQKNHPSKSARTKHFIQDVMSNDVFKERTNLIHDMVKKYMKIVDTTVLDMAPKYIIMFIVKAVSNHGENLSSTSAMVGRICPPPWLG